MLFCCNDLDRTIIHEINSWIIVLSDIKIYKYKIVTKTLFFNLWNMLVILKKYLTYKIIYLISKKNYKFVHIYVYPTTDRQSYGSKLVGTECRLTHVSGLEFEPGYCTVASFVFNIQNDVVLYQIWQIWFKAASFIISITKNN